MIPSKRKSISKNFGGIKHKLTKENVKVTNIDSQTFEHWLRDDIQFRFSNSFDVTGTRNRELKSNQNDHASTSSKEVNSLKSYSSGADSQFSLSDSVFPLISEQDISLISQPEFRPLFEKLILHVHSKQRVEIVRNSLINHSNKNSKPSVSEVKKDTTLSQSKYANLLKQLEDSKLNFSHQSHLKKENIERLNSISNRCSELEKKRSELISKIQEAKQKIALKHKLSQETQEEFLPNFDPGYYSKFKNISESYLSHYNENINTLGESKKHYSSIEEIPQILNQIKETTREGFQSKADANSVDKYPDFTEIRKKVRGLVSQVPLDQISKVISTISKEANIKLDSDIQTSSLQKDSFHKQKVATYERIILDLFDKIPYSGYSIAEYIQSIRKLLFAKQIELKEALFHLQSIEKAITTELNVLTDREDLPSSKKNLLRQLLLLKADIRGLETSPEVDIKAPATTSYHLKAGFHSSSLNLQLDEDIYLSQNRLSSACQGIRVLLRTFQLQKEQEPLKSSFDYTQLVASIETICQKSETSIESELKSFDSLEISQIISPSKNFPLQFKLNNYKSLDKTFLYSTSCTTTVNAFNSLDYLQLQPFTWYKTVGWIYPSILDIIQIKRKSSKLVSDFEKQAHSHLSQWSQSLLEWNYYIRQHSKEVNTDVSFSSQNLQEDLKELFYQVNQLWCSSKKIANSSLDYTSDQLIPIIQKQCFEIHSYFEERDGLLKEFPV